MLLVGLAASLCLELVSQSSHVLYFHFSLLEWPPQSFPVLDVVHKRLSTVVVNTATAFGFLWLYRQWPNRHFIKSLALLIVETRQVRQLRKKDLKAKIAAQVWFTLLFFFFQEANWRTHCVSSFLSFLPDLLLKQSVPFQSSQSLDSPLPLPCHVWMYEHSYELSHP